MQSFAEDRNNKEKNVCW